MGHSFHQIWIHLVWSTKDRQPLLTADARAKLFAFLHEYALYKGFPLDSDNGIEDHVRCLLHVSPSLSVSQVAHALKGASSRWLNQQGLVNEPFQWQVGFGAFSVSKPNLDKVRNYIARQVEHHAVQSFEEEMKWMTE